MNPAILNLSLDHHAHDPQYLAPRTNISDTPHATESVEAYGTSSYIWARQSGSASAGTLRKARPSPPVSFSPWPSPSEELRSTQALSPTDTPGFQAQRTAFVDQASASTKATRPRNNAVRTRRGVINEASQYLATAERAPRCARDAALDLLAGSAPLICYHVARQNYAPDGRNYDSLLRGESSSDSFFSDSLLHAGVPNAVPELPQSTLVDPYLVTCMQGHIWWRWFFDTVQWSDLAENLDGGSLKMKEDHGKKKSFIWGLDNPSHFGVSITDVNGTVEW
ncbi:hypothetical protein B0H14DRAFT_3588159 [Mycena olivaceomarginata]|nr:hypothetical protein B0H14DRAFT_3588159 [Mycena olivaceomarginata]